MMETGLQAGLSRNGSFADGDTALAETGHGSPTPGGSHSAASAALLARAMVELAQCLEALRMAEEVLQVQGEALRRCDLSRRAERRRYRDLLATVSDPLLVTGTDGVILSSNRSCARLLGSRRSVRVGGSALRFLVPEDRLPMLGVLRGAAGWEGRLWLSPRQGEDFWAVVSVTPVCSIGNEPAALRWMIRPA